MNTLIDLTKGALQAALGVVTWVLQWPGSTAESLNTQMSPPPPSNDEYWPEWRHLSIFDDRRAPPVHVHDTLDDVFPH